MVVAVIEVADIDGELTAVGAAAEVGVELAIDEDIGALLSPVMVAVAVTGEDVADGEEATSGSLVPAGTEPAVSVCCCCCC